MFDKFLTDPMKILTDPMTLAGFAVMQGKPLDEALTQAALAEQRQLEAQRQQYEFEEHKRRNLMAEQIANNLPEVFQHLKNKDPYSVFQALINTGLNVKEAALIANSIGIVPPPPVSGGGGGNDESSNEAITRLLFGDNNNPLLNTANENNVNPNSDTNNLNYTPFPNTMKEEPSLNTANESNVNPNSYTSNLMKENAPAGIFSHLTPDEKIQALVLVNQGKFKDAFELANRNKRETIENEKLFRNEFLSNPTSRSFQDINEHYSSLIAFSKLHTVAGDIALIYRYIKMLDDRTGVKENEIATVKQAGNLPERIRQIYNQTVKGQLLTSRQREQFIQAAGEAYKTVLIKQSKLKNVYQELAIRNKVNPKNVILDFEDKELTKLAKKPLTADEARERLARKRAMNSGRET
jgi:hypothetical protein